MHCNSKVSVNVVIKVYYNYLREMLDIPTLFFFFSEFNFNLMCHNPMRLWHTSQNNRSHEIMTHQVETKF
jgi:hypothetical protein